MNSGGKVRLGLAFGCVVLLGSCGGRDEEAYARGWNAGHEEGLREGRREGRTQAAIDHQNRWGLIGLAMGTLAGAALVALATRKHLAQQRRRRKRRKELERMVGSCKVELDVDLHAEVMAIARKRASLQARLERDAGPLIGALADRLRPELLRLDTQLLDVAALLQQLRDLRQEAIPESAPGQRAGVRRANRGAGDGAVGSALRDVTEMRRIAVQRNADNIARCENQLAGLAAFLDELTMRLGNLKAIEQADAFGRFEAEVGKEIDALAAAYETTLARLTRGEPGSPLVTNRAGGG